MTSKFIRVKNTLKVAIVIEYGVIAKDERNYTPWTNRRLDGTNHVLSMNHQNSLII